MPLQGDEKERLRKEQIIIKRVKQQIRNNIQNRDRKNAAFKSSFESWIDGVINKLLIDTFHEKLPESFRRVKYAIMRWWYNTHR